MIEGSGYPLRKVSRRPSGHGSRPPVAAERARPRGQAASGTLGRETASFRANTHYPNKGLTLVELLVVIGILALTASLGAFFVKNQLPRLQLNNEASELAATLDRARRLSVAEQRTYGVAFDLAQSGYRLVKLAGASITVATSTLPQNISFASTSTPFTNNTARFNGFGGAAEAGNIILQNLEGQSKIITVNPSGYVRVE